MLVGGIKQYEIHKSKLNNIDEVYAILNNNKEYIVNITERTENSIKFLCNVRILFQKYNLQGITGVIEEKEDKYIIKIGDGSLSEEVFAVVFIYGIVAFFTELLNYLGYLEDVFVNIYVIRVGMLILLISDILMGRKLLKELKKDLSDFLI